MIRRRPPAPQSDDEAVGLSGWLYADLILGLAVIFLALVVFVPRVTGDSTADQTPPTTTVDLAPTVASLEDRVESLTAEKAKLLEQIAQLEEQAESLDSDNENFLNRIAELEEQAESLDSEIEKLLDQIAELEDQTEIADLEEQANSLQAEQTIIEIELARLGNTNDGLQEQLQDAELRASRGVEQNFYCFRIEDAGRLDKKDLAQQVQERLEGMDLQDREAGIVLTFGVGVTTNIGIPLAESFNEDVLSHDLLTPVLGGAVLRHFWNGKPDAPNGKPDRSVEVNLYLWQEGDHLKTGSSRC